MIIQPNFIVIGAGKCATTSLCELLAAHADAFVSDPKEPNFFSDDDNYFRGWEHYCQLFANADGCVAIGEGSGRYTCKEQYPETAQRIASHLPQCRLIYIVREPIARIESLWKENIYQGMRNAMTFERSLREQPDIYIASTNYYRQIQHYRKFFPDEQILVLFFEEFKEKPDDILVQCFKFLGLRSDASIPSSVTPRNVSQEKRADAELLLRLRSSPLAGMAKNLVPSRLRSIIMRRFMRREMPASAPWTDELKSLVYSALADDLCGFLSQYDRPHSMWNLQSVNHRQ